VPAAPLSSLERLGDTFALDASAEKKRMLVIVNPYATTVSDRLKTLVVYALQGRYEVEAVDTERRDHATELCREAAHEGYDVVVAFGGDGTVNEAANGLLGSATPLTCLPGGSSNVFCRMLGIPADIVDATEHLLRVADNWSPRAVDMGIVNGRRFTFSSGVGLDASVVKRVDANPRLKARLRDWYFTYVAIGTFTRRYLVNPPRMHVALPDGRSVHGVTAVVQNAHPFTYFKGRPIHIAEGAQLDSADLAGAVLERASPVDMPTIMWRAFSRRAKVGRHRRVTPFGQTTSLRVSSADGRPLPLHVDGDYIGEVLEAEYGVDPSSLHVVA
jgi:diacylglycerol kinase family enzyme